MSHLSNKHITMQNKKVSSLKHSTAPNIMTKHLSRWITCPRMVVNKSSTALSKKVTIKSKVRLVGPPLSSIICVVGVGQLNGGNTLRVENKVVADAEVSYNGYGNSTNNHGWQLNGGTTLEAVGSHTLGCTGRLDRGGVRTVAADAVCFDSYGNLKNRNKDHMGKVRLPEVFMQEAPQASQTTRKDVLPIQNLKITEIFRNKGTNTVGNNSPLIIQTNRVKYKSPTNSKIITLPTANSNNNNTFDKSVLTDTELSESKFKEKLIFWANLETDSNNNDKNLLERAPLSSEKLKNNQPWLSRKLINGNKTSKKAHTIGKNTTTITYRGPSIAAPLILPLSKMGRENNSAPQFVGVNKEIQTTKDTKILEVKPMSCDPNDILTNRELSEKNFNQKRDFWAKLEADSNNKDSKNLSDRAPLSSSEELINNRPLLFRKKLITSNDKITNNKTNNVTGVTSKKTPAITPTTAKGPSLAGDSNSCQTNTNNVVTGVTSKKTHAKVPSPARGSPNTRPVILPLHQKERIDPRKQGEERHTTRHSIKVNDKGPLTVIKKVTLMTTYKPNNIMNNQYNYSNNNNEKHSSDKETIDCLLWEDISPMSDSSKTTSDTKKRVLSVVHAHNTDQKLPTEEKLGRRVTKGVTEDTKTKIPHHRVVGDNRGLHKAEHFKQNTDDTVNWRMVQSNKLTNSPNKLMDSNTCQTNKTSHRPKVSEELREELKALPSNERRRRIIELTASRIPELTKKLADYQDKVKKVAEYKRRLEAIENQQPTLKPNKKLQDASKLLNSLKEKMEKCRILLKQFELLKLEDVLCRINKAAESLITPQEKLVITKNQSRLSDTQPDHRRPPVDVDPTYSRFSNIVCCINKLEEPMSSKGERGGLDFSMGSAEDLLPLTKGIYEESLEVTRLLSEQDDNSRGEESKEFIDSEVFKLMLSNEQKLAQLAQKLEYLSSLKLKITPHKCAEEKACLKWQTVIGDDRKEQMGNHCVS